MSLSNNQKKFENFKIMQRLSREIAITQDSSIEMQVVEDSFYQLKDLYEKSSDDCELTQRLYNVLTATQNYINELKTGKWR